MMIAVRNMRVALKKIGRERSETTEGTGIQDPILRALQVMMMVRHSRREAMQNDTSTIGDQNLVIQILLVLRMMA